MKNYVIYSKEVKEALKKNKPIVALESTIITHGMPYPANYKMALKTESIINSHNVVAATIAIIDGKIHVGLNKDQLEMLAKNHNSIKISKRDLSFSISQKKTGGTTVAATMIISHMVGIKVFATGGIGGVHHDYSKILDVSADLEELSNIPICVVSSGPKAILDIPKTLEYLETKGVITIGYKTNTLPLFYSSNSPFRLEYQLNDSNEIANLIKIQEDLNIDSGILVFNPINKEHEIPYKTIKKDIDKAIFKANEKNIKGKELTPFLLEEINNITKGKSLEANLHLVYNNALLAAKIAKSYNKLKQ